MKDPSYVKHGQINCIIESILEHHGIDPFTHHRTDEVVNISLEALVEHAVNANVIPNTNEEYEVNVSFSEF